MISSAMKAIRTHGYLVASKRSYQDCHSRPHPVSLSVLPQEPEVCTASTNLGVRGFVQRRLRADPPP